MSKKNEHTRQDAPTQTTPEILHALLANCRTPKQKALVSTVWNNRGIHTHELISSILYINTHALSAAVEDLIEPLGWGFLKVIDLNAGSDAAWYLVPLNPNALGGTQ